MNDYPLGPADDEVWREWLDELAALETAWQEALAKHKPAPERNSHLPSINDIYGGKKGLKAADLRGRAHLLKIAETELVKFNDGAKIVLHFHGKEKGLVLNKTNAEMISAKFGEDWTNWDGCEIEVYPDKTQFNGELVDCIRVRIPVPVASASDEEVPF